MITDFRLKVFRVAAERLSFTRAAGELFITQPAVTKHINELEKQLGVPLFVRRRNAVSLTPQGRLLLDYARRLLALYAELNDTFAEEDNTFRGELTIGASTTISQYVLPSILSRFKKRYPDVRISSSNGNTESIERQVAEERLDFGLIEGNAGNPQLHYEPFMEDELVLVTASANRTLRQEEIASETLKSLPLVIRETGSGTLDVVERALATHKIPLRALSVEMRLDSTEAIKHYLYGSSAAAFVSVHAVQEELRHGLLRVIEVTDLSLVRRFSFVMRHGRRGRLCELFRQFCTDTHNRKL